MTNGKRQKYPTLNEHIYREKEGLRLLREKGLAGIIREGDTVSLSTEQAENILVMGSGAIREDIILTLRLQVDAARAAA